MKRLAISMGAFFGLVLVCMPFALGQQRNLMPAAPAAQVGPVGVGDFLVVGQSYLFRFGSHNHEYKGKVLAKPDGGWVKVARFDLDGAVHLVNLSNVLDIQ